MSAATVRIVVTVRLVPRRLVLTAHQLALRAEAVLPLCLLHTATDHQRLTQEQHRHRSEC